MRQVVAYDILNQWKIIKSSAKKGDRLQELVVDERFQLQGFDKETFGGLGGCLLNVVVYDRWSHIKIRLHFLPIVSLLTLHGGSTVLRFSPIVSLLTYNCYLFALYSCCPNQSKALVYHC